MNGYGMRSEKNGFTLLEVMVATAILAIGLLVIIELFSGGLRLARASGEYSKAVNYGRLKLEEVMTRQSIEEGNEEGEFDDGYRWKVGFKKVNILPADRNLAFEPPAELFQVRVDVLWKSGSKDKSAYFESYRTIKKPEEKKI